DWQRHHRILAQLAADEPGGLLPAIEPGVTFDGDDLGRWLTRQRLPHIWARLTSEQQERLTKLGIKAAEAPSPAPAVVGAKGGSGKAQQAFQRGVEALAQYVAREGGLPARSAVEVLPDGTEHRTGIWYGNLRARRDKLDQAQLAALAELGAEWAR
ncbi:helicase associated domain-containing protein, partial [Streptomyces sp. H27-S2]|uniref:helicase associated domain-containing protein n=1 Tax=Streptomyces antarcticus TaxID=2996458 RepID=UPI00226EB3BD